MKSGVFILPIEHRDAGNAFAENTGWGSEVYSVPLSPAGEEPAAHYGCRVDVTEGFLELMSNPPAEAAPLLAVLIADFRETSDAAGHFSDVLAANRLTVWGGETNLEASVVSGQAEGEA